MRKSSISLMIVAALVPAAASAQSSAQGTASAAARVTSQTSIAAPAANSTTAADAAAEARIRASINRATEQGVPRSTLEDKVAEGRAKGASSARIATAVEHRADVLARVNAAVGGAGAQSEATHASELTAAADAYENGVSLSSITEIAAGAGGNRAVALNVLANLVASGSTAPGEAVLRVNNALRAGGSVLAQLSVGGASSTPSTPPSTNTAPKVGASVTSTTGVIIRH